VGNRQAGRSSNLVYVDRLSGEMLQQGRLYSVRGQQLLHFHLLANHLQVELGQHVLIAYDKLRAFLNESVGTPAHRREDHAG